MIRTLTRTLLALAAAYALGAALAAAASAGTLQVGVEIHGAGMVGKGSVGWCAVSPSEEAHPTLACPTRIWSTANDEPYDVQIWAQPADGWRFDGWSDCPRKVNGECVIRVPNGDAREFAQPVAKFSDDTPPTVKDLTAVASATREGRFEVTWGDSEPGVKYTCKLGGRSRPCSSPATVEVSAGTHPFEVQARDPSDKIGAASIDLVVPDTALPVAPTEGAQVRTATPSVSGDAVSVASAQPPAGAAPSTVEQPKPAAFALSYRFRNGRFTRFEVTGAANVRVIVKKPGKRAVTLKRLIGKRLPNGTKITVRAGAQTRKLTIRRGRVIA